MSVPHRRARGLEQWRSRRQMERRRREVADAVRRRPFRYYGLPSSWEAKRALAGSSYGKKTGLQGVRLVHRIGEGNRPVTVHVTSYDGAAVGIGEGKSEMEFQLGLRSGEENEVGQLEWMRMRIPVDGAPTDFEVIAGRAHEWGAVGAVGDVTVGVEVSNFAMADVVLEHVSDLEPYLAGRRGP